MGDGKEVRRFILWYTQFYDTCVIPEYELLDAVNKEFHLSYQLNRFQDRHIDKMPQFRKYKGNDGYWIYERIDIQPDPEWTLGRYRELEEAYNDRDRKYYQENEEFLYYLEYARKNDLKDFEIRILMDKISELEDKKTKATQQ